MDTELLARSAREHDLEFLVLFGSAARGQKPPRDYDLAVWPSHPSSSLHLARQLVRDLGRGDLDVVGLPWAGWLLWQEVARDGVVLYECQPGRFRRFQHEAACRSWDANVWRRRIRQHNDRMAKGEFLLNRDLVEQALALLNDYLVRLESTLGVPAEEFAASFLHYHACERLLELMVEEAARLNAEVGTAVGKASSTDYYSSFFVLASAGWIDNELAQQLGELARLRNTLVHRYQELSPHEVYEQARASLPSWRRYLACVNDRLAQP